MANTTRLDFIDVLRAVAILLMLQGHFVSGTLGEAYRDTSQWWYAIWLFMRGLTAPLFFTVTGLVFTYLLLKDGRPLQENIRWKKGIRRGGTLILIGYLLKFNLGNLHTIGWQSYHFTLDVLHCIGLALLSIAGLYAFTRQLSRRYFGALLLFFALFAFLSDPWRQSLDSSGLPRLLAHYVTAAYGSVFTPLPWVGYSLFGALLGTLLHWRPQLAYGYVFPASLSIIGILTFSFSSMWLMNFHFLTGWEGFKIQAHNNALFIRAGHAWVFIAIFMWVVGQMKQVPKLLTSIGSETLTIYCGHYVLLYGSGIGFSLIRLLGKDLSPLAAYGGALLLILFFIVLVASLPSLRAWWGGWIAEGKKQKTKRERQKAESGRQKAENILP